MPKKKLDKVIRKMYKQRIKQLTEDSEEHLDIAEYMVKECQRMEKELIEDELNDS